VRTKYLVPIMILLGIALAIPKFAMASANGLTIHAFQISGESANDEFVSISNDGVAPLQLQNYSVSRKTKTGTSWNTLYKFTNPFSLSPHQVIVIANAKYTGVSDFLYSTGYYLSDNYSIAIIAPDKSIVDLVGYGDANSFEGTELPDPDASEIYTRTADTDNNLADFKSSLKAATLDPNIDKVVISEIMPNPEDGEEWFELYNQTNLPVNLSGTKVCDGVGSVHCYFFGVSDFLAPNEYKIYSQETTKITMNNSGDWLEFRDSDDDIIADTGGNYGNTDKGISLALFGDIWQWTKTPTPAAQNIYTDTVEIESDSPTKTTKTKSSKTKIKKAVSVNSSSGAADDAVETASDTAAPKVTAADNGQKSTDSTGNRNQVLGYTLLGLAVIVLLGYNLWDKRKYVRDLYDKICRRND
jgi:hypothetical protein